MRKRKREISMQTDIMRYFVFLFSCAMLLLFLYCGLQISQIIEDRRKEIFRSQLDLVSAQLQNDFATAIDNSEMVLYYDPVQNIMFQWNDSGQSPVDNVSMARRYLRIVEDQFQYKSVRLFVQNADSYFMDAGSYFFNLKNLPAQIPTEMFVQNRAQQVRLVETYQYPLNTGKEYRLSVVRFLTEQSTEKVIGAVSVDFDSKTLLSRLSKDMDNDTALLLLNQEGHVLASDKSDLFLSDIPDHLTESIYQADLVLDGKYMYLVANPDLENWRLCMRVPRIFWFRDVLSLMPSTVIICFLIIIIFLLLVVFVSKKLMGRLLEVTDIINNNAKQICLSDMGNMRISQKSNNYREVRELVDSYNNLIEHIQDLSERNRKVIQRENRYRMEALRMQINSHFLYNALASIKGYVELRDVDQATDLLMNLSKFFNYTLDRKGTFVPLRDEIMMIEKYLDVQKTVYEDMFVYEVTADSEVLNAYVPHFILQPIVENALVHGAMEAQTQGKIEIVLKQNEEDLLILVKDNGPGFEKETLPDTDTNPGFHGIGMKNVYKRLSLYFGERAVMNWGNSSEGGLVSIEIHGGGLTEEERSMFD